MGEIIPDGPVQRWRDLKSPKLMAKKDFAVLVMRRQPSALSNWLASGKLTAAAFKGEGRAAKVVVAEALRQLDVSLDVGQQLAQANPVSGGGCGDEDGGLVNSHQARIAAARAEQAEIDLRAAQRKEAAETGQWVEVDLARAEFGRLIAQLISATEAHLQTEAPEKLLADLVPDDLTRIAEQAELPVADVQRVLHALDLRGRRIGLVLRDAYREHRRHQSRNLADEAATLPEALGPDGEAMETTDDQLSSARAPAPIGAGGHVGGA